MLINLFRKTEAPTNEEIILQRMKNTLDCLNSRYQSLVEGINKGKGLISISDKILFRARIQKAN